MRRPPLLSLAVVTLTLGIACTSEPSSSPADATPAPDATARDAGFGEDAGRPDAAPSADAAVDAGVEPPTVESLANQLADSECAFVTRCRELELAERGGEAACRSELGARWRAHIGARDDLAEAAMQVDACRAALEGAQCWQAPRGLGHACWPIRSEGRRLDEGCARSEDCADGFCLSARPGLECGTCAPWRGPAEGCEDDPGFACGADARCEAGRCRPLAAIGLGCDGECRGFLDCVFDFEAVICLTPRGPGEPCNADSELARQCPEERALACVDLACARATLVELGEPCDALRWCRGPEHVCARDGRCQLRPRADLGGACEIHLDCVEAAYCEAEQCVARRGDGEACTSPDACLSPLACLGAPATCRTAPTLDCR